MIDLDQELLGNTVYPETSMNAHFVVWDQLEAGDPLMDSGGVCALEQRIMEVQ